MAPPSGHLPHMQSCCSRPLSLQPGAEPWPYSSFPPSPQVLLSSCTLRRCTVPPAGSSSSSSRFISLLSPSFCSPWSFSLAGPMTTATPNHALQRTPGFGVQLPSAAVVRPAQSRAVLPAMKPSTARAFALRRCAHNTGFRPAVAELEVVRRRSRHLFMNLESILKLIEDGFAILEGNTPGNDPKSIRELRAVGDAILAAADRNPIIAGMVESMIDFAEIAYAPRRRRSYSREDAAQFARADLS